MKRRHFVAGLGATTVGASALVGSGAFSRTDSQRNMTVETVGDEDAYLRLEYPDKLAVGCEDETTLLWVTNQLRSPITDVSFEFAETADGVTVDVRHVPDSLDVGQEGAIVAQVTCEGDDTASNIAFDIEVSGDDLEVRTHRTDEITVACSCPATAAWAVGVGDDGTADPTANRLNEVSGIETDRWGWYVTYTVGAGEIAAKIWAGADGNDLQTGTHIGNVSIEDDGDVVSVETALFDEYAFSSSQLSVDTDADRLRETNADPGQFRYTTDSETPGGRTYAIPFATIAEELAEGDELLVALHGDLSG